MSNIEQTDYWNGAAGRKWVAASSQLDLMLAPFADMILTKATLTQTNEVLDIGCGGGALSLQAAESAGSVTGVDVSRPLLDLARSRAGTLRHVSFIEGDAALWTTATRFDMALSRFGVMFFDDPVQTFKNIREHMSSDGRLIFTCWQAPSLNDWARTPLEVAMPFLTTPPELPDPKAPGPFAFQDPNDIKSILAGADWRNIDIESWTGNIILPGESLAETAGFMMEMGPLSRLLKEQDIDRNKVREALVERLKDHENEDGSVSLKGAVWLVSASV